MTGRSELAAAMRCFDEDEPPARIAAARERFRRAKITMSHAAAAALANLPEAEQQASDALAELESARAELREAEDAAG